MDLCALEILALESRSLARDKSDTPIFAPQHLFPFFFNGRSTFREHSKGCFDHMLVSYIDACANLLSLVHCVL